LNIKKTINEEKSASSLNIRAINRVEFLNDTEFYSFDIVLILNPTKIAGFLLDQCSKLVNENDPVVFLFLSEDHLSNQLLRSKDFSLNWKNEDFNFPFYFIINSPAIKTFYDHIFSNNLNQFSNLYKK